MNGGYPMRRTHRAAVAALLGLALVATACGDDEAADDTTGTSTEAAPEDRDAEGDDGADADCPDTAVTYENLETGESVDVVASAAASLVDGAAYTIYLADYDISVDSFSSLSAPEIPDDGNLLSVAVTIFNAEEEPAPLEAGTTVEYTDDFGVLTFRVTQQAGEELFGTNTDAEGQISLTAVGDVVCAEVDYTDAQKTLSGTIRAATKAV